MREIKFRAWDKWNSKMANVVEIRWVRNGDEIKKAIVQIDVDQDTNKAIMLKDLELMQFTGLKDKNGKEIYEGDVIQWEEQEDWSTNVYKKTAEVKFVDGAFRTHTEFTSNENNLGIVATWGEVIGNIYENPELLK